MAAIGRLNLHYFLATDRAVIEIETLIEPDAAPCETLGANVYIEDFVRKRSGLSCRRLHFNCASHEASDSVRLSCRSR